MKIETIRLEMVDLAPKVLEPGVLYVSSKYKTVIHLCCCGCGEKVITPLSAAEWQVSAGRDGVSLFPSIGNWSMACRSHYWIRNGRVSWAGSFTKRQIRAVHKRDKAALDVQYQQLTGQKTPGTRWLPRWAGTLVDWLAGR